MSASSDQSEHEFLSFCQTLGENPGQWRSLHIAHSTGLDHNKVVKDIGQAGAYLQERRQAALGHFTQINTMAKGLSNAVSYIFTDNDIMLFANVKSDDDLGHFKNLTIKTLDMVAPVPAREIDVASDYATIKRLAADKIATAQRMRAIQSITDNTGKQATLSIRRQERKLPLVMIVEDDRFTATYTAQLLTKECEIFHIRTGEEAAQYYLDYAPDVVFLDLHLPGMSGHQTLQLIKAIDPGAYVVMLSVDASKGSVVEASLHGASCYLKKPYDKERLMWTVKQAPRLLTSAGVIT